MHKLLALLVTFFLVQTYWLKDAQNYVVEANNNATLVDSITQKEKNGQTTVTKFIADDVTKLSVTYDYDNLVELKISYYSKNNFLFAQRMVGQDVLIYKRERLANEPYASLIESNTYFKSASFGIRKSRKIDIHESDNIEELKLKLKKKKFDVDTLDNTVYKSIAGKLLQLKTTHNIK
ncbi:MAG: hypothetical protein ABJH05_13265 [Fulvivirga sp.]